jgi:hypothetical protein
MDAHLWERWESTDVWDRDGYIIYAVSKEMMKREGANG